eukprot:6590738-Prymnesium_polylepis.1
MHTTKRPSQAPLRLDTHAGWSDTDVIQVYKRTSVYLAYLAYCRQPTPRGRLADKPQLNTRC